LTKPVIDLSDQLIFPQSAVVDQLDSLSLEFIGELQAATSKHGGSHLHFNLPPSCSG
jgi:hypothetical protein